MLIADDFDCEKQESNKRAAILLDVVSRCNVG